jgi:hypothetical protein
VRGVPTRPTKSSRWRTSRPEDVGTASRAISERRFRPPGVILWRMVGRGVTLTLWFAMGTSCSSAPSNDSFRDITETQEGAPCGDYSDGSSRIVAQCSAGLTCASDGTLPNGSEIAMCTQAFNGCDGDYAAVYPTEPCSGSPGFRCTGDLLQTCALIFDPSSRQLENLWSNSRHCQPGTCDASGTSPTCPICAKGTQCGTFMGDAVCLLPCRTSSDCIGPFEVCTALGCNFQQCNVDADCPADTHCGQLLCQQGASN